MSGWWEKLPTFELPVDRLKADATTLLDVLRELRDQVNATPLLTGDEPLLKAALADANAAISKVEGVPA